MMRSLGLRSDAMVQTGLSTITSHTNRYVFRTPSEPDYWSGNMIIMRDAPSDPVTDVGYFPKDFPGADHARVAWDVPDMAPEPVCDALVPLGFEVDSFDVLSLSGDIVRAPAPSGIVLRALESDQDWQANIALQSEIGLEEGFDPAHHLPFLQRRTMARRTQIATGLGAWFGAFDGDMLVAHLGMFCGDGIARYQAVETKAAYRRRGFCAALLMLAYDDAMSRDPAAQVVIVAEADSNAGRLYRRMGFALAEKIVEANKNGY